MQRKYATITSKGQVTIPAYIRKKLRLLSGNKLEFIVRGDSFEVLPINKSVSSLRGILPKPEKSLTIEEMDEAIRGAYDRA